MSLLTKMKTYQQIIHQIRHLYSNATRILARDSNYKQQESGQREIKVFEAYLYFYIDN